MKKNKDQSLNNNNSSNYERNDLKATPIIFYNNVIHIISLIQILNIMFSILKFLVYLISHAIKFNVRTLFIYMNNLIIVEIQNVIVNVSCCCYRLGFLLIGDFYKRFFCKNILYTYKLKYFQYEKGISDKKIRIFINQTEL